MVEKLKVLINGQCMLGNKSGVGKFAYQLALSLHKKIQLGVFGTEEVQAVSGELPYLSPRRHGRIINRLKRRNPWYDLRSDFPEFSLYHELNYVPYRFKGKVATTIYDLSYIRYPQYHPEERIKYLKRGEKRMRNADAILTISSFVREEIVEILGIPEEKIFVAYPGVAHCFKTLPLIEVEQKIAPLGLSKGYLLYVGNLEPRKNLETLIKAYSILGSPKTDLPDLVITGAKGWLHSNIFRTIKEKRLEDRVKFLDYVSEDVLPYLYCGAALFIYPSYYEGFGMPIIEAMACGTPVITSNTSSMPEAAGGAALLIDPNDVEMLAAKIEKLLGSNGKKTELTRLGLERVKELTWENCAENVIAMYKQMLA